MVLFVRILWGKWLGFYGVNGGLCSTKQGVGQTFVLPQYYMDIYICAYTPIHTPIHMHMHITTYIHVYIDTAFTYIHKFIYTYRHVYICTNSTHILFLHIYIYTDR